MCYSSYVFGIDIMMLKKTIKGKMLHRFTPHEEYYLLNNGIPYRSVNWLCFYSTVGVG